jgi:hypothetical protein
MRAIKQVGISLCQQTDTSIDGSRYTMDAEDLSSRILIFLGLRGIFKPSRASRSDASFFFS